MKNPNLAERHLLPHEVDVDLDVLGATMLHRVRCHVNSTNIVTKDNCRSLEGMIKFLEELPYPAALGNDVGNGTVFRFSTRARNSGLSLRGPRHKVVAKIDTIPRRGASCVWATSPISIREIGRAHV